VRVRGIRVDCADLIDEVLAVFEDRGLAEADG
jgi:hypothetical protein